jgi:hypothetical protein
MKKQQPARAGSILNPEDVVELGDNLAGDEIQESIAKAAYYRAQERGFEPGEEMNDWLIAEAEIKGSRLASSEA